MPARKVIPIVPDPARVRRIHTSFAWLDHRLLRDGHLDDMSLAEIALYVFLVLAADRNGVSFYNKATISKKLNLDWDDFERALLEKELIAFRPFSPGDVDGFYQVLPLPGRVEP